MSKPHRTTAVLLKLVAILVLLAGAAIVCVPPALVDGDSRFLAWAGLAAFLAMGLILWGVALLLQRQDQIPPEMQNTLSRVEHQVMDLQVKLKELYLITDRSSRPVPAASGPGKDHSAQLQQLADAIRELRELSLLPDAERRQRSHLDRQNRKLQLISELFSLVGAQDWARAERLLITLQTDFPNDDDVAKGRNYLDHSRGLVEAETISRAKREIDELMASANWDQAWEKVRTLVEGFPTSSEARSLHNRIQREYDIYCETTAQRIFEGIRHDIDQRNWRPAYLRAQQLIEQFPSHRVAETLRPQLHTLRENAEIQERQELEVRIQELIREGEFDQAIELAEDVIRRFPLSPQADSLEMLLPRIRELASEEVSASEIVS